MLAINLLRTDLVKATFRVGIMINPHERVQRLTMVVVKEIKIIS